MAYIIPEQTFQGVEIPSIAFVDGLHYMKGTNTARPLYLWFDAGVYGAVFANKYIIVASAESGKRNLFSYTGYYESDAVTNFTLTSTATFDGKKVYYRQQLESAPDIDYSTVDPSDAVNNIDMPVRAVRQIAWLMVYGGYTGFSVTYDLINCVGDPDNPTIIPPNAVITNTYFTVNEGSYFGPDNCLIDGNGFPPENPVNFVWDWKTGNLKIGVITSDIVVRIYATDDPYSQDGESGEGGGHGDFDGDSDSIDIPPLPDLSAVDTGFITLFNPTTSQLQALANYMWSSLFDLDTFKKLFADPMSCILGLSIVPVNVPSGGTSNVTVGNISTGVSMTKASRQYVEVDCGTINVNEYWGAYLDYDPYTKAEIYLPYIGTHPLAVDDIMNKPVHVVYHVDVLSGACIAYVKCGDSVLYSFIGQCSSSIPITGNDWTNVINGVLSIAGAVGTMVATGGASAPMAASMIASTAVNSLKPTVEKSGALSGTGGVMGIQMPYLILTRPRQALPKDQNKFTGYPSFINVSMNSLSGYTEIESVHLDNVPATDSEINEIESILKSGVIF